MICHQHNTQFVVRTIIYHLIVKTETLRMNERANDLFSENVTQFPNQILEKIEVETKLYYELYDAMVL